MEEVKKGERWYVSRAGALCLIECLVTDITAATVEIVECGAIGSKRERYTKKGLMFIERTRESGLSPAPEQEEDL